MSTVIADAIDLKLGQLVRQAIPGTVCIERSTDGGLLAWLEYGRKAVWGPAAAEYWKTAINPPAGWSWDGGLLSCPTGVVSWSDELSKLVATSMFARDYFGNIPDTDAKSGKQLPAHSRVLLIPARRIERQPGDEIKVVRWSARPNRGAEVFYSGASVIEKETEYWEDKGVPCRQTRYVFQMKPNSLVWRQGYGIAGWINGDIWQPSPDVVYWTH